jgi:hypothetical protein
MILTGHMLIGGAIGVVATTLFPSPWTSLLTLGLGIVSHHLLDLLPHTDAATFWPDTRRLPWFAAAIVAVEVVLACSLTGSLFVAQHTTWAFAAGATGGVLPDFLDEIPLWQQWFRRSAVGGIWHRLHLRWHCADMAASWWLGLVIDAVVVGAGLWFLLAVQSTPAIGHE